MASTGKAPAGKTATGKTATGKTPAGKTATGKATRAKKTRRPPFGEKFVNEMKNRLLKERSKYLHSAEEYQAEANSLLEAREPGDVHFDEEGGEGDTIAGAREQDLALSKQARQTVEQIDAALSRIERGVYGLCVVSGKPIPQARLRAIPWAAERVEVKTGVLGRI